MISYFQLENGDESDGNEDVEQKSSDQKFEGADEDRDDDETDDNTPSKEVFFTIYV